MPELPEVETIRRDLKKNIFGKKILEVEVYDHRVLRNCTARQFAEFLRTKTFAQIERKGKALIFSFGRKAGYLVVQPMMTGQLVYTNVAQQKDRTTKLRFRLSNDSYLNYNDQRLFGRLNIVNDLSEIKFFQSLGPDPLSSDFQINSLKKVLLRKKTPIKTFLMDQNFIAGIGNIYASEILYKSKIHPVRSASSLTNKEMDVLFNRTVEVLKEAVHFRGTSMNNYRDGFGKRGRFKERIKVYGRESEQCTVCQSAILKIVQAGRSTFFCQKCQH